MDAADNLMVLLKDTHKKLERAVTQLCMMCERYRFPSEACKNCEWKEMKPNDPRRDSSE